MKVARVSEFFRLAFRRLRRVASQTPMLAPPSKTRSLLLLLATSSSLLACGFVREVRRSPNGGEIAIRGRTASAEKEAADLMNARCATGYDVLEEGEVVVGQQTIHNSQGQGTVMQTRNGRVTQVNTYSQGTTSTQNTTEWRILYQCKSGAGTPPPPQPEAPVVAPTQPKPESRVHELRIRL